MTLVLVAHGTRVPAGQGQIRDLARRVALRRSCVDVRLAYVDVQAPHVRDVAARLTGPAVVIPLLLTAGYHVRVDIAEAVAGVDAVVTPPLGAAGRLLGPLADRLDAAGPADAVVLAAAGSSDPRSRADVAAVADALPVSAVVAYTATTAPRVPDVVRSLRAAGADRVVVLAYLLADGRFYRSLARAGADVVTPPLATHPAVVDVVLAHRAHVL
jgi:sirohydrochlorin ferrochelatase